MWTNARDQTHCSGLCVARFRAQPRLFVGLFYIKYTDLHEYLAMLAILSTKTFLLAVYMYIRSAYWQNWYIFNMSQDKYKYIYIVKNSHKLGPSK